MEEMCCKECHQCFLPNFMLWNGVCVFCWYFMDSYRGKKKSEAIIKRKI